MAFYVIFMVVCLMFFAGRIYELLNLTDFTTGFLSAKGIVANPLTVALIVLVAVCCGVIIFSGKGAPQKRKYATGLPWFISGMLFIAGAIFSIMDTFKHGGFLGFDIAIIIASAGVLWLGILDIKGKKREKIPFLLTMLLPVAFCLNSVIYEVSTVHNSLYTMRVLSYMSLLVFLLMLFKSVYRPDSKSDGMLFSAALVNVAFSLFGIGAVAICSLVKRSIDLGGLMSDLGFVVMGVYSLTVSLIVLAKAKNQSPVKKKIVEDDDEDFDEDEDFEEEFTDVFDEIKEESKAPVYTSKKEIEQTRSVNYTAKNKTRRAEHRSSNGKVIYKARK